VIVFGGNARGKTNLLTEINMLKNLVLFPTYSEIQKIPYDTFGYSKENTIFKIKFMKMDQIFDYEVAYNASRFTFEKLCIDEKVLFERRNQEFIILPKQLIPVQENVRKIKIYFSLHN